MTETETFRPNWTSPPGDTIADVLNEKKLSLAAFSKRIGCSIDDAKDLVAGRMVMSVSLARKLHANSERPSNSGCRAISTTGSRSRA
jgi:plasmid maintenance system antidote protein VapI